jgi:hypothetical protein
MRGERDTLGRKRAKGEGKASIANHFNTKVNGLLIA